MRKQTDVTVSVPMHPSVRESLKTLAEAEDLSMSQWVRRAINRADRLRRRRKAS